MTRGPSSCGCARCPRRGAVRGGVMWWKKLSGLDDSVMVQSEGGSVPGFPMGVLIAMIALVRGVSCHGCQPWSSETQIGVIRRSGGLRWRKFLAFLTLQRLIRCSHRSQYCGACVCFSDVGEPSCLVVVFARVQRRCAFGAGSHRFGGACVRILKDYFR